MLLRTHQTKNARCDSPLPSSVGTSASPHCEPFTCLEKIALRRPALIITSEGYQAADAVRSRG